ncbi:hypothetical protein Q9K01_01115 [Qipengyuania sp. DY56-A-20]|jgi:hypothetical protein|uniref:Uncharacterized protein n=1 Tax=Qipengyuania benthica TaxID=3067651 RepID=A0ABT9H4I6_9SPHN|nr:hypothetical protein [Qipengyuania sp. DY56-A-20]MDP4538227.1 hypothetical protein [Qipengyuania sp. DY56-A-20]
MARYISGFALTELLISAAFSSLIGDKGPVTHIILHRLRNISERINMLGDLAQFNGHRAIVTQIEPIRIANKRRIQLAHGLWFEGDDGSLVISTNVTDSSRKRTETDIDESILTQWLHDLGSLNTSLRMIGFPVPGEEHGLIYS